MVNIGSLLIGSGWTSIVWGLVMLTVAPPLALLMVLFGGLFAFVGHLPLPERDTHPSVQAVNEGTAPFRASPHSDDEPRARAAHEERGGAVPREDPDDV